MHTFTPLLYGLPHISERQAWRSTQDYFFNTGYPLLLNGIGLTKILAEDSKSFTEVLAPVHMDTVGAVTKTV